MKLSTLKIERFGARSNLQLADLSDHLNVVHGPNGSGKTTVINFIRWMMYGNVDGSVSRYLATMDGVPNVYQNEIHRNGNGYPTLPSSPIYQTPRASGEITVRRANGHLQRIIRQDDGTATGRVSISESDSVHGGAVSHSQLNGVDLNEYRTVFSFGFDQTPSLEQVIQTVGVHGFELTVDERRLNRIQQLTEQLHRQRAELAQYSHIDIRHLTERRDAIHREIANLENRKRERLTDIERQRSEILAQIEQRRSQLAGIQSWLRQVESTIETRRNQLESAAREHMNARENYEGGRQRKIEETDRQIQQWHQVLDSIRSRYEELQAKHFGSGTEMSSPHSFVDDDSDLRCVMSNLGYHVDDIEQDLAHLYHFDDRRDFEAKHEYLRGIMGTALQAMRADVSRLADQARRYKSAALKHEYDAEMKHLRRCETELTELIDSLSKRRNSLSAAADATALPISYSQAWPGHSTPPFDYVAGVKRAAEPVVRPWYETRPRDNTSFSYEAAWANGEKLTYEQWKERDRLYYAANRSVVDPITGVYRESRSRESVWPGAADELHLTSWAYRVDPVLEARLFHLQNRRDQITPRVQDLESQIRDLESRLDHLNHAYGEEDRRIEQLRAEFQQIEEQLRLAQDYDRLRQAVKVTEEELARLQADMGSSEVMREASAILNRLTCGKYSGIRITQGRQIVIDETSRGSIEYAQAGRGTRDQAYLAVCLALVAEYKRRGVEQPLILNDIFINIDEERANATAIVLSQFAAKGHQVVVFTRHERVMELLAVRNAKVFPLGQRVPKFIPPKSVVREPIVREPIIPVTPPPAPKSRIVDETRTDWVSHWELPDDSVPTPPVAPVAQTVEPITPRPVERTIDVEYFDDADVGLGSPLDTVPTIDVNLARHFRDIGVVTIGQFLELDPEDAAHRLARHRISTDEIARWQSEIALQVYLCVSGSDAQILVECGISDPEELAIADLDQLLSRISGFLSSEQMRLRYQPYSRMDRDTLAGWIEMARRSNYRRRQKQNYTRRSNASRGTDYSRRTERRERPARSEKRSSEPRVPVRTRTAKVRTSEVSSNADEKMKFYLNPADPIVDAPSIGPKTAERFHAVGINTVAEFLACDPVTTADEIGYRRITAEIITEWQIQARLACQIPNLRGHDAQILAACEVTTARDLSRADSSTLFNRVKRFVSTTEGKRILRNGKKPDQNEVSDWIRWSQDSRTVQVA